MKTTNLFLIISKNGVYRIQQLYSGIFKSKWKTVGYIDRDPPDYRFCPCQYKSLHEARNAVHEISKYQYKREDDNWEIVYGPWEDIDGVG